MSTALVVVAVGVVDAQGVRGSAGVQAAWSALGVAPPGTARSLRQLFGVIDPDWRRLDRASRALILAAEAAGLGRALASADRDDVALVVQTGFGCLDADRRFAACRPADVGAASLFPGTLPSAAPGALAIRFGLRGPTLCLCVDDVDGADDGLALAEAARLLEDGEAALVVTGAFDVLGDDVRGDLSSTCDAVVALLAPASASAVPLVPWHVLREARQPFVRLAAAVAGLAARPTPPPSAPSP